MTEPAPALIQVLSYILQPSSSGMSKSRPTRALAQVTLRGDEGRIVIGEGTNIQDGTTVHMTGGMSHTLVGKHVTVGHNCILHGCQIGDNALIGMGSIVLDNAKIGEGVLVGAGSLITQNKEFPPHTLVFGNPAPGQARADNKEREDLGYSWRHYVEHAEKYRQRG
jgi:carbonic anhydrase/acetyltransferase-like protein (isoleucine patch superfamily)